MQKLVLLLLSFNSLLFGAAAHQNSQESARPTYHASHHVVESRQAHAEEKKEVRGLDDDDEQPAAFTIATATQSEPFHKDLIQHSQVLNAAAQYPEPGNQIPLPASFNDAITLTELKKILIIIHNNYHHGRYNIAQLEQDINNYLSNKDLHFAAQVLNISNLLLLPLELSQSIARTFAYQFIADTNNQKTIQALKTLQPPMQKLVIGYIFLNGPCRNYIASHYINLIKPQKILQAHTAITHLVLTPDNQRLAVNSGTNVLTYNLQTKAKKNLSPQRNEIETLALSPDGIYLAAADRRAIFIFHMPSQELVQTIDKGARSLPPVAFSQNNLVTFIVIKMTDPLYPRFVFKQYDISTGTTTELYAFEAHVNEKIASLQFSPNNRFLVATEYNRFNVYDTQNKYKRWESEYLYDLNPQITFDKTDLLIAGSHLKKLTVTNLHTKNTTTVKIFNVCTAIAHTPFTNTALCGFDNGTIRFVDYLHDTVTPELRISQEESPIAAVAISSDGQFFLACQGQHVYIANLMQYNNAITRAAYGLSLDQTILIHQIATSKKKMILSDNQKALFATLPAPLQNQLQEKLAAPSKFGQFKQLLGGFSHSHKKEEKKE